MASLFTTSIKPVEKSAYCPYCIGKLNKNGALEFIHTPEGYMEPIDGGYDYVYRLTDHLGNTRVSFKKNNVSEEVDVLETNDY
ncbi:hypothetical protein OAB54_03425 [Flavobacteriaceae bacterium]|nr:hypothetical protein [Flavobacteriaceae bacterium]